MRLHARLSQLLENLPTSVIDLEAPHEHIAARHEGPWQPLRTGLDRLTHTRLGGGGGLCVLLALAIAQTAWDFLT